MEFPGDSLESPWNSARPGPVRPDHPRPSRYAIDFAAFFWDSKLSLKIEILEVSSRILCVSYILGVKIVAKKGDTLGNQIEK